MASARCTGARRRHLDVGRIVLGHAPGHGDDLDGHLRMAFLHGRRSGAAMYALKPSVADIRTTPSSPSPRIRGQGTHRGFHGLSGGQRLAPRSVVPATCHPRSSRPPMDRSSAAMRREMVVWLMPSSSAAVT